MRALLYGILVAALTGALAAASATTAGPAAAADTGSAFTSVPPLRVLDTRWGTGGITGPVGPARTVALNLSAQLPADATAVVLNVTGVSPTASTYVTVFPHGTARPNASNLNLVAGDIRPNLVTVAVGTGRTVDLYNNSGNVQLLADLAGYYRPGAGDRYTPLPPARVLETTSPLDPGATRTIPLNGRVPASATSVTLSVTGVRPTASTFVTAWPTGATRPGASNLNLPAGSTRSNMVTVPVGAGRQVSLFNNSGQIDVRVDLTGFYTRDYGALFVPVTPQRVLDTRNGIGASGAIGTGQEIPFFVGTPNPATGVLLNVTGVQPTAATGVGVWSRPVDSNAIPSTLSLARGEIAATLAAVSLDPVNSVSAYNAQGSVHAIADLFGYFVLPAATCTTACAYAWGDNTYWQLGTGQARSRSWPLPAKVVGLSGVKAVVAGDQQNRYALRTDGTVWAWGNNNDGELGNGWTGGRSAVPVPVVGLTGVTALAADGGGAVALRTDGTMWAWGGNNFGEFGNGTRVESPAPVQVPGMSGVAAIAMSSSTVYAVRTDGSLWEWGNGATGGSLVPVRVPGPGVTSVAAGWHGRAALRSDGTVWTWGSVGLTQVPGMTGATSIAAGAITGYAVRADGTVWAWGDNRDGQLGNGVTCVPSTGAGCRSDTPVQVSGLTGVTAVASYDEAGYALRSDGTVWAWGRNDEGLGDGHTELSTVPVRVASLTAATAVGIASAVG